MQLRILLTIEVPAGLFEQAEAIAKVNGPLADFLADLLNNGVQGRVESTLAEAPKTRAPRADKGTQRMPKIVPAQPARDAAE